MKSDDELVQSVRSGDGSAFEPLAERYYPVCLRYARAQLGRREDAEEAVQDALVRSYRALLRGASPDRFRPWLLRIVVNRCRSMAARGARRRRLLDLWQVRQAPEMSEEPRQPETDADPALAASLAALKPKLREAFLLKYVEELTYEEMALVTGARPSALKMRVKRATEQLREALKEED